jgi:hypothetical protein
MVKFISSIDIFPSSVKLYMNNFKKSQTLFGGLLTITMFSNIIIMIWFLGNDIIYKQNPFTYTKEGSETTFPIMRINRTNMPFACKINNIQGIPHYDDDYYKIYFVYYYSNLANGTTIFKPIPSKQCTQEDFPSFKEDQFKSLALDSYICPTVTEFDIFGSYSGSEISLLAIQLKLCDWETLNNTCRSKEEIQRAISGNLTTFEFLYADYLIDIKNYSSPIQQYLTLTYRSIDPRNFKQNYINLQENKIKTDNGFFLKNEVNMDYLKPVEERGDFTVVQQDKRVIAFQILSSNFNLTIMRQYIKVPDVLASVGGFLKLCLFMFTWFNQILNYFEENQTLINEIFNFSKENNFSPKKLSKENFSKSFSPVIYKSIINVNTLNPLSPLNIKNNENNICVDDSLIYEKLLAPSKKLELYLSDKIKILCKKIFPFFSNRKNKKEYIFTHGVKRLKDVNLISIIKSLGETQKLKKCIFSQQQLMLFNMVNKIDLFKNELSPSLSKLSCEYEENKKEKLIAELRILFKSAATDHINANIKEMLLEFL